VINCCHMMQCVHRAIDLTFLHTILNSNFSCCHPRGLPFVKQKKLRKIFLKLPVAHSYCMYHSLRGSERSTVVRAMNAFNGKCHFSGSSSSRTPEPISKKFCTVDYVGDPTQHAKIWTSRPKGGVSAHA